MAQQVKVLTIKPGDLSPIPWTHMIEGDGNSHKLSSDHHICAAHKKEEKRGWKDGSVVLRSIPSTHMVGHSHL